jgi:hypothetical protein
VHICQLCSGNGPPARLARELGFASTLKAGGCAEGSPWKGRASECKWGLGSRVEGSGFKVKSFGFSVQGFGLSLHPTLLTTTPEP